MLALATVNKRLDSFAHLPVFLKALVAQLCSFSRCSVLRSLSTLFLYTKLITFNLALL